MLDWLLLRAAGMSYPRRQEFRRLSHASTALIGCAIVALLALGVARMGEVSLASALVVIALVLALYARHWFVLAGRTQVGALGR